jgi:hypothetical protein
MNRLPYDLAEIARFDFQAADVLGQVLDTPGYHMNDPLPVFQDAMD